MVTEAIILDGLDADRNSLHLQSVLPEHVLTDEETRAAEQRLREVAQAEGGVAMRVVTHGHHPVDETVDRVGVRHAHSVAA